jgi:hypothetical protein
MENKTDDDVVAALRKTADFLETATHEEKENNFAMVFCTLGIKPAPEVDAGTERHSATLVILGSPRNLFGLMRSMRAEVGGRMHRRPWWKFWGR